MFKRLQVADDAGLHGSSPWSFLSGAVIILLIIGAAILLVVTLRRLRGKKGKGYRDYFCSPELKAQVSFSDRLSLVDRPFVYKLFKFSSSSFPDQSGQYFSTNLGTKHSWGFKFIQMKGLALLQGDIITK